VGLETQINNSAGFGRFVSTVSVVKTSISQNWMFVKYIVETFDVLDLYSKASSFGRHLLSESGAQSEMGRNAEFARGVNDGGAALDRWEASRGLRRVLELAVHAAAATMAGIEFTRVLDHIAEAFSPVASCGKLARHLVEHVGMSDRLALCGEFFRGVWEDVVNIDVQKRKSRFKTMVSEKCTMNDVPCFSGEYCREMSDEAVNSDDAGRVAGFERWFVDRFEALDDAVGWRIVMAALFDGVEAAGSMARRLGAVVKIVSTCLVRDFFIKRILGAQAELNIKSKMCLVLEIESRIR
jgi:hypothetical protein